MSMTRLMCSSTKGSTVHRPGPGGPSSQPVDVARCEKRSVRCASPSLAYAVCMSQYDKCRGPHVQGTSIKERGGCFFATCQTVTEGVCRTKAERCRTKAERCRTKAERCRTKTEHCRTKAERCQTKAVRCQTKAVRCRTKAERCLTKAERCRTKLIH